LREVISVGGLGHDVIVLDRSRISELNLHGLLISSSEIHSEPPDIGTTIHLDLDGRSIDRGRGRGSGRSRSGSGGSGRGRSGSRGSRGRARRRRSRRRRRGSGFVNCRAWDDVAGDGLVDVDQHAGIGVLVVSGEGNTGGRGRSRSRDGKLNASNVWLNSVDVVGTVEGDDLTAEQVVSRSEIRGNGNINTALSVQQSVDSPASASESILIDLKPNVSSTRVGSGEVNHDGTLVGVLDDVIRGRVGIVMPLNSNG